MSDSEFKIPLKEVVFSLTCPGLETNDKMADDFDKLLEKIDSIKMLSHTVEDEESIEADATIVMLKNGLRIHQFTKYSWKQFKIGVVDIVKAFQTATKVEEGAPSLRYVNVIKYENDNRNIADYVNVYPCVNEGVKDISLERSRVLVEKPVDSPKGKSRIDVSLDEEGIVFEVGFVSSRMLISKLEMWYDDAHNQAKDLFVKGVINSGN